MPHGKSITCLILSGILFFSVLFVRADIPKNPELREFSHLLDNSPFDIKLREIVKPVAPPKVVVQYHLRGVTKLVDGWMIVLVDRKSPNENIILEQGTEHSSKLKIIDVIQNKEDYKLTEAILSLDGEEMKVKYNDAELKVATAPEPEKNTSRRDRDRDRDRGKDKDRDRKRDESVNDNSKKTETNQQSDGAAQIRRTRPQFNSQKK